MLLRQARQRGASLIEVLVALVILAIGILGMSALLTSSLRVNQSAYLRTQATFHAQDMVERMRANKAAIEAGNYHSPTPALTAACATASGCSNGQMAAHDMAQWNAAVAASLPAGAAVVCRDSTPDDGTAAAPACDGSGGIYAVKIWWDDDRDGTAEYRYVLSFRP